MKNAKRCCMRRCNREYFRRNAQSPTHIYLCFTNNINKHAAISPNILKKSRKNNLPFLSFSLLFAASVIRARPNKKRFDNARDRAHTSCAIDNLVIYRCSGAVVVVVPQGVLSACEWQLWRLGETEKEQKNFIFNSRSIELNPYSSCCAIN